MNKNFFIGVICGIVMILTVIVALGYIYDYVPEMAQVIWPNSVKFKEIEIWDISYDNYVGSLGNINLGRCRVWYEEEPPVELTGFWKYDFDRNVWLLCNYY